ncbi:MAG: phosphoribosyltransferase [Prevotella sp.]|nr:phosphoribosyltransferase [Prevotella sp.]
MIKFALYDYLPKRYMGKASFEEMDLNRRILDFKDGRNYAKRWAAHQMAYCLQSVDLHDVIVICLPASCQHTYTRRYKRFMKELCERCHAVNGFGMVRIHGSREKRHLSRERCHISPLSNATIDAGIKGHKVLVVDDICTTCSSANDFIDGLRAAGAEVVLTMFLAKTRAWS